jgi:hypothetical protein
MYTPELSVSNQKGSHQQRPAVFSDPADVKAKSRYKSRVLSKDAQVTNRRRQKKMRGLLVFLNTQEKQQYMICGFCSVMIEAAL